MNKNSRWTLQSLKCSDLIITGA